MKQYFDDAEFLPELKKLIGNEAYAKYKDTIVPALHLQNAGPHDLMTDPDIRRREFERIAKLGVKGVKVDFWGSDKHNIMQQYIDLIEDAARYKILVNTHGSTIPRGWSRTYPNLLTMEGVMGAEMYGSPAWPEQALIQNTCYPFIRNVVGSMDYTPVAFSVKNPAAPHLTTFAHELALPVVYESGLLHIADKPEAILAQPAPVIDFLKNVPVTWDETWLIDGYPADFAIIARKAGNKYYIGGINGKKEPRTFPVALGFADFATYTCTVFKDGAMPDKFAIETLTATPDSVLSVNVLPAGGFVVVMSPSWAQAGRHN